MYLFVKPPYNADRNQESVKPVDDRRQSNTPAPAPTFIPVPKPINPVESNVNRVELMTIHILKA